MQQQTGARQVFQETVSQACAFGCAFNQAGDIGHHEAVVFVHAHHAQIRVQRGERIIGHFRARGGHGANQRGFARVRHAEQAHVRQHFEFQQQRARLAFLAVGELFGCAVHGRFEMDVAQAAFAAFRHADALAVIGQIGNDFVRVCITDERAHGHVQFDVVRACAVAVGAVPFFAVFGLVFFNETVFHQRVHVFVRHGKHAAAASAVAAVRPAARYEFFAPEAGCAVAAASAGHFNFGFVYEFHGVFLGFFICVDFFRIAGCFPLPNSRLL